ncbi:hypothetical protein V1477_018520 [Vespula maculifrons]|uniref:Uncharacterized protein n=1 Tax=Vespula maculifrons TaxID=7453 RepID=A0ABD2AVL5_VESMC
MPRIRLSKSSKHCGSSLWARFDPPYLRQHTALTSDVVFLLKLETLTRNTCSTNSSSSSKSSKSSNSSSSSSSSNSKSSSNSRTSTRREGEHTLYRSTMIYEKQLTSVTWLRVTAVESMPSLVLVSLLSLEMYTSGLHL